MSPVSASSQRRSRSQALRVREAGLRKVSVATRLILAGSIGATGVFAVLAGWGQAGRTKSPASAGAVALNQTGPGNTDSGAAGLSPPVTQPAPGYQYSAPMVVSGAS